MNSRRDFLRKTATGTAAVTFGAAVPAFSAKSHGRAPGANEKVRVAVMGVNSRGRALANNFARQQQCEVIRICDVDSRAAERCLESVAEIQDTKPGIDSDYRRTLESKDVDAVVIAAPDHWHAPATLMALKAGKHVYVEKPLGHNPREGEILLEAASRYGRVIQMGNQRRSWPNVMAGIEKLHNGAIGRVYFARSWYANNRGPIGFGKETAVPEWLDWELWQGPAPRRSYKDNLVHYNWHWFWHWGTGEALNNGTHSVDLMRWGLDVDYPVKVSSNGGRYRYQDDWETPDTQVISIDFQEGVTLTWEGRSCNGKDSEGSGVGTMFYGEEGSLMISSGNEYTLYDLDDKVVETASDKQAVDATNRVNPARNLDGMHIQNFLKGITDGEDQHSDLVSGHKSTLLVQLGNIAQRVGRSLEIDPADGHIIGDYEAAGLWARSYEPGWEMKI